MPEAWTHWECCTCHKRFSSYGEAERCEGDHIVKAVTDSFSAKLKDIMGKGERDATR